MHKGKGAERIITDLLVVFVYMRMIVSGVGVRLEERLMAFNRRGASLKPLSVTRSTGFTLTLFHEDVSHCCNSAQLWVHPMRSMTGVSFNGCPRLFEYKVSISTYFVHSLIFFSLFFSSWTCVFSQFYLSVLSVLVFTVKYKLSDILMKKSSRPHWLYFTALFSIAPTESDPWQPLLTRPGHDAGLE